MKKIKRALAVLLALSMILGMLCSFAGAAGTPSYQFEEAVDLFTNLEKDGTPVIDALYGTDLGAPITRNEAAALINTLKLDGRQWETVAEDFYVTGFQFTQMLDKLLCDEGLFSGVDEYRAYYNCYLAGFTEGWASLSARTITREEALQLFMNSFSAKVRFGDTWTFAGDAGVAMECSTDPSVADALGRPARRWLQNGQPITDWHIMPALFSGSADTTTHTILERIGMLDWSQDGGFVYNRWCIFDIYINGEYLWQCPKCHWQHETGDGCQQNYLCDQRTGTLEVYYVGEGWAEVNGETPWCFNYVAVYDYADSIQYEEAVDLFSNLKMYGQPVINALGGKLLGGKAKQPITRNEAATLINTFRLENRMWDFVQDDYYLTGDQYCDMVDILLCTYDWFSDAEFIKAQLNNYLTGLNCTWDEFASRRITREEALQVLMNAMDAKVQAGTWLFGDEFHLTKQTSAGDADTDAFGRPIRRWLQNGQPITNWHSIPATYIGQATLTDHEILEKLGVFKYEGGFDNNTWCMLNVVDNGGSKWSAAKCHWGHGDGNSDMTNALTWRPGSTFEFYYMGAQNLYVADAGGNVDCRVYQVVLRDAYLTKIVDKNISIYNNGNNHNEVWGWPDDRFPSENGYYLANLSTKGGVATMYPYKKAEFIYSPQQGMDLPAADGNNYVYTNQGKTRLSFQTGLGWHSVIANMDYYYSGSTVKFFYDDYGNVIGATDPFENSFRAKPSAFTAILSQTELEKPGTDSVAINVRFADDFVTTAEHPEHGVTLNIAVKNGEATVKTINADIGTEYEADPNVTNGYLGSKSFVWDGTDSEGNPVTAGNYQIVVSAEYRFDTDPGVQPYCPTAIMTKVVVPTLGSVKTVGDKLEAAVNYPNAYRAYLVEYTAAGQYAKAQTVTGTGTGTVQFNKLQSGHTAKLILCDADTHPLAHRELADYSYTPLMEQRIDTDSPMLTELTAEGCNIDFSGELRTYEVHIPAGRPQIPQVDAQAVSGSTVEIQQAVIPDSRIYGSAYITVTDAMGEVGEYEILFVKDEALGFQLQFDDYWTFEPNCGQGADVTYSSNDPSTVSVDENGVLHALKLSDSPVTITAKVNNETVDTLVVDKVVNAVINLFLITGQSNASGTLDIPSGLSESAFTAKELSYSLRPQQGTAYCSDVDFEGTVKRRGFDLSEGRIGFSPALAKTWYELTGEKVYVIQSAGGGSPIEAWEKPEGGNRYTYLLPKANFYETTMKAYGECLSDCTSGGYQLNHTFAFWLQGETCMSYKYVPDRGDGVGDWWDNGGQNLTTKEEYFDIFMDNMEWFRDEANVEFMGILLVRTLWEASTQESRNLQLLTDLTAPRAAQYALHNQGLEDIALVSRVCDYARMESYPDTNDEGWGLMGCNNLHYNQIGHNANGVAAAQNTFARFYDRDAKQAVEIELIKANGRDRFAQGEVLNLKAGATYQTAAIVLPIYSVNQGMTYFSENEDVCTVDSFGMITAIGAGSTTLRVVSFDGSLSFYITVQVSA